MRLNILATGIELTAAIRSYTEGKLSMLGKMLERYESSGEIGISVEIGHSTKHHKHGNIFYAEATVRLPGATLRVEENDADLYSAIDKMKDTLKSDIIKYKNKLETKVRHNLREGK